jgi:hypothetical protein
MPAAAAAAASTSLLHCMHVVNFIILECVPCIRRAFWHKLTAWLLLLFCFLQFLKDSSNTRDDEYGGSDENKARCEADACMKAICLLRRINMCNHRASYKGRLEKKFRHSL